MCKKYKLGVIGAGFMASAIIKGAINSNVISAKDIIVSDVNEQALEKLSVYGVNISLENKSLVDQSEFVLFAVKPQSLNDVLDQIKDCFCEKFISIMAGIKKQRIKSVFPFAKVVRCMPNTPCAIGSGAIGADISELENVEDIEFVKKLLESLSIVVYLPEEKLNVVTGISGSAPAYFYLFVKGMIEAGVENGLSYEDSKILVVNTMIGAGKMIFNNSDKSLDALIEAVCSKGGTTIEAVKVYNENELTKISRDAISACVKRANELEEL